MQSAPLSFRQAVHAHSDIGIEFRDEAIRRHVALGRTARADARTCVALARVLEAEAAAPVIAVPVAGRRAVQTAKWTEFRAAGELRVRSARVDVFGQPEPPFTTRSEAARWLSSCPDVGPDPADERRLARINREIGVLNRAPVRHYGLSAFVATLAYWQPDGQPLTVVVRRDDADRSRLLATVQDLARLAGVPVSEPSLLDWVLTGRLPVLDSVSVRQTLVFAGGGVRRRVTIELDADDLTDETLRAIRRAVRGRIGLAHRKAPDRADRQLLAAVRKAGPPPAARSAAYWKAIARAVGQPPAAYRALRQKYPRALARQWRTS